INDILSIQKEVAQGQVDSLVPILFLQYGSLQQAIRTAAGMMSQAVQTLDDAADALQRECDQDPLLKERIGQFVDGCKYACTGSLHW
ncbi:hypothetical protein K491DRAFT_566743, partial [Lophiostoma macrostomum CBS 122681]